MLTNEIDTRDRSICSSPFFLAVVSIAGSLIAATIGILPYFLSNEGNPNKPTISQQSKPSENLDNKASGNPAKSLESPSPSGSLKSKFRLAWNSANREKSVAIEIEP